MFLSRPFELDIENNGNRLIARLSAAKRVLTRFRATLGAFFGTTALKD